MKKQICILFCLAALALVLSGFAVKPETCGDYTYFVLQDNTVEIMEYTGSEHEVTIPETLDGYPVSMLSNGVFYGCASLYQVTIPDSITHLIDNPFCNTPAIFHVSPDHPTLAMIDGVLFEKSTKKLVAYPCNHARTTYTVPTGIREIGANAFTSAQFLTEIILPDTVTTIGELAFRKCSNLKQITLPDSVTVIDSNPFVGCSAEILVSPEHPNLEVIDGVLFDKNEKKLIAYLPFGDRTAYTVPEGTREIGEDAFWLCNTLTTIELPETVTVLGDGSFYECENLQSIVLSDSITDLPTFAFTGCNSLASVKLPAQLQSVGFYAFSRCGSLENISLPGSVTSIDNGAFSSCSSLSAITIPESVQDIGPLAFSGCTNLTEVTILGAIPAVKSSAFFGCSALGKVTLPESVTAIEDSAFWRCKNLKQINLPGSIEAIAANAFENCYSKLTADVERDSYAAQYCKASGIRYQYPDSLAWLTA